MYHFFFRFFSFPNSPPSPPLALGCEGEHDVFFRPVRSIDLGLRSSPYTLDSFFGIRMSLECSLGVRRNFDVIFMQFSPCLDPPLRTKGYVSPKRE